MKSAIQKVAEMWARMGYEVFRISPEECYDRAYIAVMWPNGWVICDEDLRWVDGLVAFLGGPKPDSARIADAACDPHSRRDSE
jgi:hypothetical protein